MKKLKKFFALLTAAAASIAAAPAKNGAAEQNEQTLNAAWDKPAVISEKNEIIYARLGGDGACLDVYAVNHFVLNETGGIQDFGDYSAVKNLTDFENEAREPIITLNGDSVTAFSPDANYYYQGYLSRTYLPWTYKIAYFLDGAKAEPQELAGKSGHLEITFASAKNGGVFSENYMQQITFTLDGQKCENIKTSGAAEAYAGKNRVLAYTVLPGKNADIKIEADIRDFEMAGVQIAAMPFSMSVNIPEIGGLLDDFSLLSDAIAEISDGAGKLNDGAEELKTGAALLTSGGAELSDACSLFQAALTQIADALGGAEMSGFDDLKKLPGGLVQIAGGLAQVSSEMKKLGDAYALSYAALDTAIESLPVDYSFDQELLYAIMATADKSGQKLLTALAETYAAAMTVKGTYAQTKQAFAAVSDALSAFALNIDTLAAALSDTARQIEGALAENDITAQMTQLTASLNEISENYTKFHGGLIEFTNGVAKLAGDGIAGIADGTEQLSDGTKELAKETADLPKRVENEIDALIADFDGGDYEIVSFTSEKNTNVSSVQFVFITEGVKKPAARTAEQSEAKRLTFWNRLTNLFT